MKIAINGTFLMKKITGVQRYAYEMIKGFRKIEGLEIIIFAPKECLLSEISGFKIIKDKNKFSYLNQWWLWEQCNLPKLCKEHKDYLLWSPANTGPLLVENQVVTLHDAAVFEGPEWFSKTSGTYYRWLLPKLTRRVKHIFTVSNFSKNEIIKYGLGKPSNISVVYPGVSDIF
ncbi:hypothetical protein N752_07290 [Desulforamulus aquiferis]|nr:glycosyltransferase [Desulforamulus aquiferis]RYD05693.1 hypothetical protein N752_07290 [Desulforamulus aquiferis]